MKKAITIILAIAASAYLIYEYNERQKKARLKEAYSKIFIMGGDPNPQVFDSSWNAGNVRYWEEPDSNWLDKFKRAYPVK